jgi:hypothetical protein
MLCRIQNSAVDRKRAAGSYAKSKKTAKSIDEGVGWSPLMQTPRRQLARQKRP